MTRTDRNGRFELTGLFDRPYSLGGFDRASFEEVRLEGIPAGTAGVFLQVTGEGDGPPLVGVCVDTDGRAMAGVELTPHATFAIGPGLERGQTLDPVTTDEDGAFRIDPAPRSLDSLQLAGPNLLPGGYELEPEDRVGRLRIVVPRRAHLKVESVGPHVSASSFELRDAGGRSLRLFHFQKILGGKKEGVTIRPNGILARGRSQVYAAADTARTIVLYAGEREVARQAVELEPGEVRVVRFD